MGELCRLPPKPDSATECWKRERDSHPRWSAYETDALGLAKLSRICSRNTHVCIRDFSAALIMQIEPATPVCSGTLGRTLTLTSLVRCQWLFTLSYEGKFLFHRFCAVNFVFLFHGGKCRIRTCEAPFDVLPVFKTGGISRSPNFPLFWRGTQDSNLHLKASKARVFPFRRIPFGIVSVVL